MERLLIERFIDEENVEVTNPEALHNHIQTEAVRPLILLCRTIHTIHNNNVAYEHKASGGHLVKTATLWLSVTDHTRLMLMLYAVRPTSWPFSISATRIWQIYYLHMIDQTTQVKYHFIP